MHLIPNKKLARQLAIREIPSLVYDAVNLEGVAITLPEVQTILDGITVGGHKISDQNMVINQAAAWRRLIKMLDEDRFSFSKPVALELHMIAGKEEAIEWGVFRSGNVTIAGADYLPPPPEKLEETWLQTELVVTQTDDIYDKAITAFLKMSRAQFFWDVNKRMGRFMMNGILLDRGFPVINVPARRQLEFNTLMLDFYETGLMDKMNTFLRSCMNTTILSNFLDKPDKS